MPSHRIPRHLLTVGFGLLVSASTMAQLTVILDLDISTAPGPPAVPGPLSLPAGPATGFESSISVTSGTAVTVIAYVVQADLGFPGGSVPVAFDSLGLDLNWGAVGDTAALVPITSPLAGLLAGITGSGLSEDYALGAFPSVASVAPGDPLATVGTVPIPGYSASIGGAGFADITPAPGTPGPPGEFSGFGSTPPVGTPATYFDVFGVTFLATGSPGDSVTVTPSGIFLASTLAAGVPGLLGGGSGPLFPDTGGDAAYSSVGGATISGTMFIGGTITIIPEPSITVAVAAGLCLGFVGCHRRRTRVG